MKKKIEALIEVRKIIALTMVYLFVFLSIRGEFAPEVVMGIITMVIGYYFGKSTALDKPRE